MKEKHALWVAATNTGGSFALTTPAKREALDRYNLVTLAERFGWTPQEVAQIPADVLHDMLTIVGIRDAKQKSPSPRSHGR